MPLAAPDRVQLGQLPGAGGAQGDAAAAGTAQLAADDQQPGAEHGGGVGALGVLEERRVDRAGAVVEGEEDDPATGPDRRGLGGDLDPGDQQLGLAAAAEQVLAAGGAELVEEGGVGVDDVAADVEAEDLELGAHAVLGVISGSPLTGLAGLVAEGEGELDRVDRPRRRGVLGLGGGARPDALLGERHAARAASRPPARGPAGRCCCGGRPRRRGWAAAAAAVRLPGLGEPAAAQAAALRRGRGRGHGGRARRPGAAGRGG